MDSGSEMPGILPIPGISARNDSAPVFRHPKIFVLHTGKSVQKFCQDTRKGLLYV